MQKLKSRILKVWESPDFSSFLKKIHRKPHVIKEGTILFNEGDPLGRLYFVKEGFVKLYKLSEEGKETTSYLLGPNYVLGVRALLSKEECAFHTAEAITNLTIITVSRKEYFDIVTQHPEYLVDLVHIFMDRLDYTEKKLEGFIFADTTARVANFLLDSAKRFGKTKDRKTIIPLEMTHQRISEFVGSFRETVTLALHRLEKEGAIESSKSHITIVNKKILRKCALVKENV